MQHIKVGGKDYPFAITFATLQRLRTTHGVKNINKLFADIEEGGFEPFCLVVYEGVKSGCGRSEIKFELTYEQFAELVDVKDMTILVDAITESMGYKKPIEEEQKAIEVSPNETRTETH